MFMKADHSGGGPSAGRGGFLLRSPQEYYIFMAFPRFHEPGGLSPGHKHIMSFVQQSSIYPFLDRDFR